MWRHACYVCSPLVHPSSSPKVRRSACTQFLLPSMFALHLWNISFNVSRIVCIPRCTSRMELSQPLAARLDACSPHRIDIMDHRCQEQSCLHYWKYIWIIDRINEGFYEIVYGTGEVCSYCFGSCWCQLHSHPALLHLQTFALGDVFFPWCIFSCFYSRGRMISDRAFLGNLNYLKVRWQHMHRCAGSGLLDSLCPDTNCSNICCQRHRKSEVFISRYIPGVTSKNIYGVCLCVTRKVWPCLKALLS